MGENRKKIRMEMRKNRAKPPRNKAWGDTADGGDSHAKAGGEQARVRNRGEMSRKRTVMVEEAGDHSGLPAIDTKVCLPGRVLRVHGLWSVVEVTDGRHFRCTVRRLLKTLSSDERTPVVCGDHVWIRPEVTPSATESQLARDIKGPRPPSPGETQAEAVIERVEPRKGTLVRNSRNRVHALVANVDQVVFVVSLVEPELKPHLVDRYLASAIQGGLEAVLCLNKADRIDPADFQDVVGLYSGLGVRTLLTSAAKGTNISLLQQLLVDRQTVFSGQSGVGKSSLLNAVQPGLGLRVREVSDVNSKGKHTTTTAELLKLQAGGWVVDTPGVRQFELTGVREEEVEGFFVEFHPFVPLCRFASCTHTHEVGCAVLQAVEDRMISTSRYHSYLGLLEGRDPEKVLEREKGNPRKTRR